MAKPKPRVVKTKLKAKPITPAPLNRMQQWFENKYKILAISILILAGLLRIGLLIELPHMPFSQLHKAGDLDMHFFNLWGDRIADGDVLTDTIWHPYHSWHKELATAFGAQTEQQGRAKWAEWYGGKKFHQEPLYPLIIGVAKMISRPGLLIVYVLQMLLGLLSIWIVMWLGKNYFSAMAAIMGGLLFTLYGPNLLFDATLLRTSFNTCLLLGMLYTAEKLLSGKSNAWVMGVLGGIGYILMTTSMLLWIPLLIRWFFVKRNDLKKSWQVALGFSVVLSFLVIRNQIADVSLLSTSSVGPITYVLSNFPKYKPELGFAYFPQAGKVMELTKGHMISSALYMINLHKPVWEWFLLQFKKLGAVFHWYEIPNNINTYLATQYSVSLSIAFIPYSLIAALGLLGIILNLKNKRTLNLLVAILTQIAIMVIFYVLCRFRIPMVAMLSIFAGYAMQRILSTENIKKSLIAFGGAIALWLLVMRPWPNIPVKFESGDLAMYFQTYLHPQLNKLSAKGDVESSIKIFENFISTMPPYIRNLDPSKGFSTFKERSLSNYYGVLYEDLGNFYRDKGEAQKATFAYSQSAKFKMPTK